VVCIVLVLKQFVFVTRSDYKVIVVSQFAGNMNEDVIAEELAKFGEDINGDGKVTEHEITNYIANVLDDYELDTNGDKDLSFDEVTVGMSYQDVMHELTTDEAKAYQDAGFDLDYSDTSNYTVTSKQKAEFEYYNKDLTADLDVNQDGKITDEDFT
jgi:hypothetical protein